MSQPQSLLEILQAPGQAAHLSDSALVIVDAQREYLEGRLKLTGIEEALAQIEKLLVRARKAGTPVFHIVHHAPAGAPIFDPQGPMAEIASQVKPLDGEPVIAKNLPSGFVGTDLNERLQETGKKNLIVTGFMTHMCVNATTRSALDLGYSPTIIDSCCATRDLPLPGQEDKFVAAAVVHASNLASLADLVSAIVPDVDSISD